MPSVAPLIRLLAAGCFGFAGTGSIAAVEPSPADSPGALITPTSPASAVTTAAGNAPATGKLHVLAASYAFNSQRTDVTARVRYLLQSEAVFQVNPGFLQTDPLRGKNKTLVIFCEVQGKPAVFSAGEGENVSRELLLEKATAVPLEGPAVAVAPPPAPSPAAEPAQPFWLGSPEVDPAEGHARALVHAAVRQQVALSTSLVEYERVGKHDPRWDDDAREALRLYAPPPMTDDAKIEQTLAACTARLQRALNEGCDDPLIVYFGLRQHCYSGTPDEDELARRYTAAERAVLASGYSPLRKFFVCMRSVEADFEGRRNADGTVGPPDTGEKKPAKSWPRGTDIKGSFQHGLEQLLVLLKDSDLPPFMFSQEVEKFFGQASSDPVGLTEVLLPLEKKFTNDEFKGYTYNAKLIEGLFWSEYAWQARGADWADTVTEEGGRLFSERLAKARPALEAAWKLDPTYEDAPLAMLPVVMGLGNERAEVDLWFHRMNDAEPDHYRAAQAKLFCLEPKWGGSAADMLEFGRQCLATQDYASRIPMMLYEAHYRLAGYSGNFQTYWKDPEVWADMHALFSAYLAANPHYMGDRTNYALCAYRAGEWQVAHEQFEILGDHPAVRQLQHLKCSFADYQRMRRDTEEHLTKDR